LLRDLRNCVRAPAIVPWITHFRRKNPAATRRGFDANVPILTSARAAPRGR
jgi:hypothetical protein